jgi:hypothetical protein
MAVFAQGYFSITGGLDQIGDQIWINGGPSSVPVVRIVCVIRIKCLIKGLAWTGSRIRSEIGYAVGETFTTEFSSGSYVSAPQLR